MDVLDYDDRCGITLEEFRFGVSELRGVVRPMSMILLKYEVRRSLRCLMWRVKSGDDLLISLALQCVLNRTGQFSLVFWLPWVFIALERVFLVLMGRAIAGWPRTVRRRRQTRRRSMRAGERAGR